MGTHWLSGDRSGRAVAITAIGFLKADGVGVLMCFPLQVPQCEMKSTTKPGGWDTEAIAYNGNTYPRGHCACVCVCDMYALHSVHGWLPESEEDVGAPGTREACNCKHPGGGTRNGTQVLCENSKHLIADSPLHLPTVTF